jgi:hypothetical protein
MSNPHFQHAHRCVVSLALGLFDAGAHAAVVCSDSQNPDIPATGEGLYINFITLVTGTTEAQVPGFDFDPYAAQNSTPTGQLKFYWGASANQGAGVVSSGNTYAVLGNGATIGPESTFSRAAFAGDTSAWQAGVTGGYLGTRFKNESSGVVNYGWVRLTTNAPLGFPATALDWCYADNGDAITIVEAVEDNIYCDGFDTTACPAPN